MRKSSSNDELTIRNQFDRLCKLVLKGKAVDYHRYIAYCQKQEVLLSELPQKEQSRLFTVDEYKAENKCFQVLEYDIEVKVRAGNIRLQAKLRGFCEKILFLIMRLPEISCSGSRGWCIPMRLFPTAACRII